MKFIVNVKFISEAAPGQAFGKAISLALKHWYLLSTNPFGRWLEIGNATTLWGSLKNSL